MPYLQQKQKDESYLIIDSGKQRLRPAINDYYSVDTLIALIKRYLESRSKKNGKDKQFQINDIISTSIDSFGAALLETTFNVDLAKTDCFGKRVLYDSLFDKNDTSIANAVRNVERNIEALTPDIAKRCATAFTFAIQQFRRNAEEHAKLAAVISWRYRICNITQKLPYQHQIIEIAYGTQTVTIKDSLAELEANRTRVLTEHESLFFAVLPGFSAGAEGHRKPEINADRGTALFFLSQTARYGGAIVIQSGRTILKLGLIGGNNTSAEHSIEVSDAKLTADLMPITNYLGTTIGMQCDSIRFAQHFIVQEVSRYTAGRFWTETFGAEQITLEQALKEYLSLERLYLKYLECEASALKDRELELAVSESLSSLSRDVDETELRSQIKSIVVELAISNVGLTAAMKKLTEPLVS